MRRLASKFGFVHRALWQRNVAYRWAALLGPPPLLGCALAVLGLTGWHIIWHAAPEPGADAPWAHWIRPLPAEEQPYAETAAGPLPRADTRGRFIGFKPGWAADIRPITIDATMDVNVSASALTTFALDETVIPLARILDAGPPDGLFVGGATAYFAAQSAGLYAFSARLVWSGPQSANCMVRLGSAHHGMIRNLNINVPSQSTVDYAPTEFRLEPGLMLLQAAIGCWRGDRAVAPGTVTILVRRPGEVILTPVSAEEVITPVR